VGVDELKRERTLNNRIVCLQFVSEGEAFFTIYIILKYIFILQIYQIIEVTANTSTVLALQYTVFEHTFGL
jgi:hypothetical protein